MNEKHIYLQWIQNLLIDGYKSFSLSPNVNRNISSQAHSLISENIDLIFAKIPDNFKDTTLFKLAICMIDQKFPIEFNNLQRILDYISKEMPISNFSRQLYEKSKMPEIDKLGALIVEYYIRVKFDPNWKKSLRNNYSLIDIESALLNWINNNIHKNLVPPGLSFTEIVGSGQFCAAFFAKYRRSIIMLKKVKFGKNLTTIDKINNWKELEVALNTYRVKKPIMPEIENRICMICFVIDFYSAVKEKEVEDVVELQEPMFLTTKNDFQISETNALEFGESNTENSESIKADKSKSNNQAFSEKFHLEIPSNFERINTNSTSNTYIKQTTSQNSTNNQINTDNFQFQFLKIPHLTSTKQSNSPQPESSKSKPIADNKNTQNFDNISDDKQNETKENNEIFDESKQKQTKINDESNQRQINMNDESNQRQTNMNYDKFTTNNDKPQHKQKEKSNQLGASSNNKTDDARFEYLKKGKHSKKLTIDLNQSLQNVEMTEVATNTDSTRKYDNDKQTYYNDEKPKKKTLRNFIDEQDNRRKIPERVPLRLMREDDDSPRVDLDKIAKQKWMQSIPKTEFEFTPTHQIVVDPSKKDNKASFTSSVVVAPPIDKAKKTKNISFVPKDFFEEDSFDTFVNSIVDKIKDRQNELALIQQENINENVQPTPNIYRPRVFYESSSESDDDSKDPLFDLDKLVSKPENAPIYQKISKEKEEKLLSNVRRLSSNSYLISKSSKPKNFEKYNNPKINIPQQPEKKQQIINKEEKSKSEDIIKKEQSSKEIINKEEKIKSEVSKENKTKILEIENKEEKKPVQISNSEDSSEVSFDETPTRINNKLSDSESDNNEDTMQLSLTLPLTSTQEIEKNKQAKMKESSSESHQNNNEVMSPISKTASLLSPISKPASLSFSNDSYSDIQNKKEQKEVESPIKEEPTLNEEEILKNQTWEEDKSGDNIVTFEYPALYQNQNSIAPLIPEESPRISTNNAFPKEEVKQQIHNENPEKEKKKITKSGIPVRKEIPKKTEEEKEEQANDILEELDNYAQPDYKHPPHIEQRKPKPKENEPQKEIENAELKVTNFQAKLQKPTSEEKPKQITSTKEVPKTNNNIVDEKANKKPEKPPQIQVNNNTKIDAPQKNNIITPSEVKDILIPALLSPIFKNEQNSSNSSKLEENRPPPILSSFSKNNDDDDIIIQSVSSSSSMEVAMTPTGTTQNKLKLEPLRASVDPKASTDRRVSFLPEFCHPMTRTQWLEDLKNQKKLKRLARAAAPKSRTRDQYPPKAEIPKTANSKKSLLPDAKPPGERMKSSMKKVKHSHEDDDILNSTQTLTLSDVGLL
ncbi:hypothetical protein TVAG_110590 [Trichomonas vaginalis G3]|uniref:Uncharacterized protein n=1 Tax=Trichomonas vaginalis (strain ATCC PRA-98 / G3) TaxID=412133 RepID=A2DGR0_TRIV3|nr:calponin-homology domain, CH-domain family [Trichomonas vaginalis G3]EAY20447.1 hypothetical protein TVAG_110590 [Trichomonas vaginalis G3]KAI5490503.1 calponin-homology domain, CH-domain family [Trichomonas vaginalis G3]|eukprot:XP_001581433.1 hypothetical protein [Trichomonas vaginalis G3]